MKAFGWYRDDKKEHLPVFGGIQGDMYKETLKKSQQIFDEALLQLQHSSKYMLDVSTHAQSIWSHALKR